MKFLGFVCVVCVLIFVLIGNSFSAVIELKNGRVVSGSILNQTDRSIKVLLKSGNEVTYYVDEIKRIQTSGEFAKSQVKAEDKPKSLRKKQTQDFGFPQIDIENACNRFFSKENVGGLKEFLCEKFDFLSKTIKSFKLAQSSREDKRARPSIGVRESIEKETERKLRTIDAKINKFFDEYAK